MSYKREDQILDQALHDGRLPGESEDFFTEAKIKAYFQQVVEREIEEAKRGTGAVEGMQDQPVGQLRQTEEQDEQAPEY